jgi:hypothetical protein
MAGDKGNRDILRIRWTGVLELATTQYTTKLDLVPAEFDRRKSAAPVPSPINFPSREKTFPRPTPDTHEYVTRLLFARIDVSPLSDGPRPVSNSRSLRHTKVPAFIS